MRQAIAIGSVLMSFVFSTAGICADQCPTTGESAWCCAQEISDPVKPELGYRWLAESRLCAGLISPRQSITDLAVVGFLVDPAPTDNDLKVATAPLALSLPAVPADLPGPIRFKGRSLKGGRYYMAGDFTDRAAKEWSADEFRRFSSMSTFGFVAYQPADVGADRPTIYFPVRLTLPNAAPPQTLAGHAKLLSDEFLGSVSASYRALDARMKPTADAAEIGLDSHLTSGELIDVTIPDQMPAAFELIVRACKALDANCNVDTASPATFAIAMSP